MPTQDKMEKTRGVKLNFEYDPLAKYMCQVTLLLNIIWSSSWNKIDRYHYYIYFVTRHFYKLLAKVPVEFLFLNLHENKNFNLKKKLIKNNIDF